MSRRRYPPDAREGEPRVPPSPPPSHPDYYNRPPTLPVRLPPQYRLAEGWSLTGVIARGFCWEHNGNSYGTHVPVDAPIYNFWREQDYSRRDNRYGTHWLCIDCAFALGYVNLEAEQ